jgi:putative flavoprotein involved in K+ transport
MSTERFDTVVVGGSQAGLAMGYHLARRGRRFVILEAHLRVGDAWRQRWDSLRLFSPARFDGLPGLPFPAQGWSFPTRDEFADYLEAYAQRWQLPVRTGVTVRRLHHDGVRYVIEAGEQRFEADNVVVATGYDQVPVVPEFAGQLDPGIRQLTAAGYRGPDQLGGGDVLVVGAGNSGADIALELSRTHRVLLSGRHPGQLPWRTDRPQTRWLTRLVFRAFAHVLTVRTPIGRKVRPRVLAHSGPLIRVKSADLAAAGVERVARTTGVRDGRPVFADGRVADVANVVWCTGFRPDTSWIDLPVFSAGGEPAQYRGVVEAQPGLYFLGRLFQYAMSSSMIGGVGRDADFIADHIAVRSAEPQSARPQSARPQSARPQSAGSQPAGVTAAAR